MEGQSLRKYNLYMEIGTAFGIFAPILMLVIRSINDLFNPGWDTIPDSQGFSFIWLSQIIMYAIGFGFVLYAQKRQKIFSLFIINLLIGIVGISFLLLQIPTIKEVITLYNPQIFLPGYILSLLAISWVINIIREKIDNLSLWVALILTAFLTSIGISEVLGRAFYYEEFNFIVNKYAFWQYSLKIYPWIMYCWTVIIWFYYSFVLHHHEELKEFKGIKIKNLLRIVLVLTVILLLPCWLAVEIKNTESMKKFVYQVDIEPTSIEGNSVLINVPYPKLKENTKRVLLSTKIFDFKTKQIRKDVTVSFINSRYGNMLRIRADNLENGIKIITNMYITDKKSGAFPVYLQPRIEKGSLKEKEVPLSYSGVNSSSPVYYEIKGEKLSFGLNYKLYDSVLGGEQEIFSQVMGGFIGKDELESQQAWQFNSVLDKF